MAPNTAPNETPCRMTDEHLKLTIQEIIRVEFPDALRKALNPYHQENQSAARDRADQQTKILEELAVLHRIFTEYGQQHTVIIGKVDELRLNLIGNGVVKGIIQVVVDILGTAESKDGPFRHDIKNHLQALILQLTTIQKMLGEDKNPDTSLAYERGKNAVVRSIFEFIKRAAPILAGGGSGMAAWEWMKKHFHW